MALTGTSVIEINQTALVSNITAATPNAIISASQTFLNTALGGGSLSTMPTTMQAILTSVGA